MSYRRGFRVVSSSTRSSLPLPTFIVAVVSAIAVPSVWGCRQFPAVSFLPPLNDVLIGTNRQQDSLAKDSATKMVMQEHKYRKSSTANCLHQRAVREQTYAAALDTESLSTFLV